MSTKDLFDRNYLPNQNEKDAFSEVESSKNVKAVRLKQDSFLPQIDYSDPLSFAKFGSARLYYSSAISRILNYYPYDGSNSELTQFYNKSLDIEKYIFNERYPRTNGYINLSANGWGSTTLTDGYGLPSTLEYITFKGGPNSISQTQQAQKLIPDPTNSQFQYSNIYDENIYTTEGLPSDYGVGTRQSNLRSDFDTGVTVEFWLQTGSLDKALTEKQVVFDWWNQEAASSAHYGRILVELTSSTDVAGNANRPFMVTVMSGATTTRNFISVGSALHEGMSDWKHYAISMANSGSAFNTKLYVNGELDDSISRIYTLNKTFPSYNSTLVANEYASENNLQGWWRLQTNGSFPDSSGNGRDGSTTASPTYNTSNTPNKYIAEASHTFDGVNDEIKLAADTVWNPIIGGGATAPKMTFAAWVRRTSASGTGTQDTILSFGSNDISLHTDGNERINFKVKWNGASLLWRTATGAITADEWAHVVVTYDATSSSNDPKIYVNGVELSVTLFSGSRTGTFDDITGNSYIGNGQSGNLEFVGQLADIAVWNSILTAGEIKSIYSAVAMPNQVAGTVASLNTRNAMGRLGALQTAPVGTSAAVGAGKLSGSLDEFRFWKTERNAKQIGQYWFDQIRGGVNSDISNASLGLYYKFNEGISGDSSIDSVVLDYGGRICNGVWTGYSALSRNTGSAIVSASAAQKEYLDPIIYASHPDVLSLQDELRDLGTWHDSQNNAMFLKNVPTWVLEEAETVSDRTSSDLERLTHIMGAYFDKLYLQIQAIPKFRHAIYPSASYDPFPFSQHLPQSLGLYTPEIFIDSDILEKIANRSDTKLFQEDLTKTKNLIYQNIYNNLAGIFKSKGTEKAIRNVLRCFNIDDNLIYLSAYPNNQLYELNNNLKQTQKKRRLLNLNKSTSVTAVVYQAEDPSTPESRGFISGSGDVAYEDKYGFTSEVGIRFPKFIRSLDDVERSVISTVSLFGMHSASVDDGTDTTLFASDNANFQVHAIRDEKYSKNVYFKLSSSLTPFPIPQITTSIFYNVYDDEDWNISVSLRPPQYPYSYITSGSDDHDYDVVFRGYNNKLGSVNNSFDLSASVNRDVARNFLRASKRLFIGATNENITGSENTYKSDVLYTDARYWTKYLDSYTLKQHAVDRENFGISGSYRSIDAITVPEDNQNSYNFNALALNWYFQSVTSSDASGQFYVTDLSSGSALIRNNFGWAGKIGGYAHTGEANGFAANDTSATLNTIVNEFKFMDPEQVVSSDMVKILSEDDELLGTFEQIPNYLFVVEKSLHRAISEEILDFFAGSIDFNNLIGDPVNRYRMEYKGLNYLRNIFFERVNDVTTVEKYIDYYKWFDDSLAEIIGQLIPASADFVNDVYNTIESHVLERNKYQSQFPTIEFKQPDPEASIRGVVEAKLKYEAELFGGLEASPRPTQMHIDFWKKRALPGAPGIADPEITSSSPTVDISRRKLKEIKWSRPEYSASMPSLTTVRGARYSLNRLLETQKAGTVDFTQPDNFKINRVIKGGVNFETKKDLHYTYTSLHPAGPVKADPDSPLIPQNVLFSETEEFNSIVTKEAFEQQEPENVGKKRKRYLKVVQGRDFTDGLGYEANKSSFAFPFNVMSASIDGGIDDYIKLRTSKNLSITNLHNDAYGDELEIPMQGPFTNYAVGGHQSRHIRLNVSSSARHPVGNFNGLDTYLTRPEAWKILIGKLGGGGTCPGTLDSGAIGMTAPDYPWPEANEGDVFPYPVTASEKAVYYRDFIAKRPVNIRNIQLRTGSTILGNFQENYQVVNTCGAWENPRQFIENQPLLSPKMFEQRTNETTQPRTFMDVHRLDNRHFEVLPDYDIGYLNSTVNKTVILSRFDAVGGMLTSGKGYRDFRSNEWTAYNDVDYKHISVTRPFQISHGQIPEPADGVSVEWKAGGSPDYPATPLGTAGIRVFDIHGRDFGLRAHASRHTARFGRDSSIFPEDNERVVYDLGKNFISYEEVETYRGAPDLQGWWRMTGSIATGDVPDNSGNGRVGTFDAGYDRPTFRANVGPSSFVQTGSYEFDDAAFNAINIGTTTTWNNIIGTAGTSQMTFAAWVYKTGDGGDGANFGRILDFSAGDLRFYTLTNNKLAFNANFSTTNGLWRSDTVIESNKWVHVIITYDGRSVNNNPKMYINGVESTVENTTPPVGSFGGIAGSADCMIGNWDEPVGGNGTRGWEGNLADVAVWDRMLTAKEASAIYNVTKTSLLYGPGASYEQAPGYHKVHRNNLNVIKIIDEQEYPIVSGPTLNNHRGVRLFETNPSTVSNPTFLLTGSLSTSTDYPPKNKAADLLAGLSGSGLTWTGWVKFDDMETWDASDEIREVIWGVGLATGNKHNVKVEKVYEDNDGEGDTGLKQQIRLTIATNNGGGSPDVGTVEFQWHFPKSDWPLLSSSYNHYAIVWGDRNAGTADRRVPEDGNLKLASCQTGAVFYFNGISQSLSEFSSTRPLYEARTTYKSDFRGKAGLYVTGSSFMNIGGDVNDTGGSANPISASLDEFTFWTAPLNADQISEIYNGGTPCDITASNNYLTDNVGKMWDWIRFERASDTGGAPDYTSLTLNLSNPGSYNSSTNKLTGYNNNAFMPISNQSAGNLTIELVTDVPAGCSPTITAYGKNVTYERDARMYDNLFVSHQIPRMTRQYAWITASLVSDHGIVGFTPPSFLRKIVVDGEVKYVDSLDFITASQEGSARRAASTDRVHFPTFNEGQFLTYGGTLVSAVDYLPQVSRLNLNVIDYIGNAKQNTLGFARTVPLADSDETQPQYVNTKGVGANALIDIVSGPSNLRRRNRASAVAFNNLMFKRGSQYGYPSWKQVRQGDHPILTHQKLNNKLNIQTTSSSPSEYRLPPLSLVGRPSSVNMDYINSSFTGRTRMRGGASLTNTQTRHNATLKTSYNNEYVLFNQQSLNNFVDIDFDTQITPFEQLVAMKDMNNIELNWVLYKENVFPALRNEFASYSTKREGYDNKFWRKNQTQRISGNVGEPNSFGMLTRGLPGLSPPASIGTLSQSMWPLDAPLDFTTRTGPPVLGSYYKTPGSAVSDYQQASLIQSNSAGELQNTYSSYYFFPDGANYFSDHGPFSHVGGTAAASLIMRRIQGRIVGLSPLYARKHMMSSFKSVANRNSIEMVRNPIGYPDWACIYPQAFDIAPIATGSGEALWEAPNLAGFLTTSNGNPSFVEHSSKPFYDSYDDFKYDIKLLAKGYSIVPEFRISEQMENYTRFGIMGGENFDTFGIPGTTFSSSQDNFYKDFSNSDFLEHFLDVRQMSDLTAKEIKLTCKAAIKFHPYKGFYPAQRTLDLTSQFSKSYGNAISVYAQSIATSVAPDYQKTGSIYFDNNIVTNNARPVVQPLFAPGILYNSIKSGIAVDYPVVIAGQSVVTQAPTASYSSYYLPSQNFLVGVRGYRYSNRGQNLAFGYKSGSFFERVPFEAIMDPAKYMNGLSIIDIEPHPSQSYTREELIGSAVTASIQGNPSDNLYSLMASNFFAEVGKFFLKDGEYTKLKSSGVNFAKQRFQGGELYGARLRIKTSFSGSRTYENESGSNDTNVFYAPNGARATGREYGEFSLKDYMWNPTPGGRVKLLPLPGDPIDASGSYEIPQDPIFNKNFKKDFSMYSRGTAFGPPVAGRVMYHTSSINDFGRSYEAQQNEFASYAEQFGARDSLNGFNWAYTPPYYDGEAWIDFLFEPSASQEYDINRILAETQIIKRRFDPGENIGNDAFGNCKAYNLGLSTLVSDVNVFGITQGAKANTTYRFASGDNSLSGAVSTTAVEVHDIYSLNPYSGPVLNDNAMNLDSSINLYGVEDISKTQIDKFGQIVINENEVAGQRWVIQPKFETPMMNFSDEGVRPISTTAGTLTLPANFGSESVPRGMWHQFGVMPEDANKGIFLEIGDIPTQWLKNHYDVIGSASAYNKYEGELGRHAYKNIKSFSDLMGFNSTNSSVRLGEVADKKVIKEAVIAVPYIVQGLSTGENQPAGANAQERKKFISIPEYRYKAALDGAIDSAPGNSLFTAGQSIRRQINKMKQYVLPPQFDFLNNKLIDPLVMYIFEFKYEFDKDDLAYMWQNLSPRNSDKMSLTEDSIAHELINTELLTEPNLLTNPNLRWMVFKVKQRSQEEYNNFITKQVNTAQNIPQIQGAFLKGTEKYPLKYNWPYDYFSIIESIRLDADVLYKDREPAEPGSNGYIKTPGENPFGAQGVVNDTLNKSKRRKRDFKMEAKVSEIGSSAAAKNQKELFTTETKIDSKGNMTVVTKEPESIPGHNTGYQPGGSKPGTVTKKLDTSGYQRSGKTVGTGTDAGEAGSLGGRTSGLGTTGKGDIK